MGSHMAKTSWSRNGQPFTDLKYSRKHLWEFDGGVVVPGSSSPHVVRVPYSDPSAVDPEEAFVAAISSCHLLTFLWIAARQGFIVNSYKDDAEGFMATNEAGGMFVERVILRPAIRYEGREPTAEEADSLHHAAHLECYIANSVISEIIVEPA
jgi:organic hydroperoxide reductase OsmC/OhrA